MKKTVSVGRSVMDQIRAQIKNPLIIGIVGFIVGTIFGLVVLGWLLWPVQWTNAQPEHLSPLAQAEYLRMAIEAYGQNGDLQKAQERFNALGESAEDIFASVVQEPQGLSNDLIQNFQSYVIGSAPTIFPTSETETVPLTEEAEEEGGARNILLILVPILCVLVVFLGAVLFYIFVLRGRMALGKKAPENISTQNETLSVIYVNGESKNITQILEYTNICIGRKRGNLK